MRSSVLATIVASFIILVSSAQAQFLGLPQYDNGLKLNSFVQAQVNTNGPTILVGVLGFQIEVLFGNGTGGFGAPITTVMSGVDNPGLAALADFNGDGILDVAISGTDHVTGQSAVAVMLGNGNGTFQAGIETILGTIGSPSGSCATSAADYNGDGKVDLAYTSKTTVVVLPGKGDGTFSTPLITSTGSVQFSCLASGDFNNDSKLDLAVADGQGQIAMLLGRGNGTFQSPFGVGKGGNELVAAQLNGDSKLDLVAAQIDSIAPITVLLGDGTGHFPTTHQYPLPEIAVSQPIAVQDLNGDGHLDIAFLAGAPHHTTILNILLNNGDGSFTSGPSYTSDGVSPTVGLFAADLNGDKNVDLAFGNAAGGLSVMIGNGNGTFKGNFATVSNGGSDPKVGKFDGDTEPDLLFAAFPIQILLGNGDGSFTVKNTNCGLGISAAGDFNNDGKLDLAGNTSLNGVPVIGVCLGNGDGTFTETSGAFDQGVRHGFVLAGNFNGDKNLDLVASDQNGISVLLGNGDGTFQNGIPTVINQPPESFVVSDFNNDGKTDVAVVTASAISVLLGKGDGTFEAPLVAPCPCPGFPLLATVADLNKDNKRDLVLVSGGYVIVYLGNGNGTFQKPVRYLLGGPGVTGAAIADFNLDGKLDLAVGVTVGPSGAGEFPEGVVDVLFGDGTGKFSAPTPFPAGGSLKPPSLTGIATADFNGDKKPDLALSLDDGIVVTFLNQE